MSSSMRFLNSVEDSIQDSTQKCENWLSGSQERIVANNLSLPPWVDGILTMKLLYPRGMKQPRVRSRSWNRLGCQAGRAGPGCNWRGQICVFKANTCCRPALRMNELWFYIRISSRFQKTQFQVHISNTLVRRRASRLKYKGISYLSSRISLQWNNNDINNNSSEAYRFDMIW